MMPYGNLKVRIFVAGGSHLLNGALAALIGNSRQVSIVGMEPNVSHQLAGATGDVLEKIRATEPDVVVLAVLQADRTAVTAVRKIVDHCQGSRLLVLTENIDPRHCRGLLRAGASGYVGRVFQAEDLLRASFTVASGGLYLDPHVAQHQAKQDPAERPNATKQLSVREAEVLRLFALGYSNKAIAAVLNLSSKTIETYKSRATSKLNLRNKVEVVRYATTEGWM